MKYSPIALFVYNRPKHTRQTVEALLKNAEAKHSDLYIFSDAPKNDSAKEAVDEVRNYIKQISGFESITIIERTFNWGLANSVIDGVTRLCEESGKVIVLEDDLVVSPHFLNYINAGLTKYEFDKKVMQISGYMFPVKLTMDEDTLFLPLTTSWGWATWQRAWQQFDVTASGYSALVQDKALRRSFDLKGRYAYFKMLKAQINKKVDSWAIRWYLTVFLKEGLVLYPGKSMVENSGFDGSGINCVASEFEDTTIDPEFKIKTFSTQINTSPLFESFIDQLPKPRFNYKSLINRLIKKYFSRVMVGTNRVS